MFALPRRQPRQRIAVGSSARLSQLHLCSSRLGLNALQCDASDGVICGRASLQRRLPGQSRKLSLPVMSRTEAESIEIGGGLAGLCIGGAADLDQDDQRRFTVGSPLHFRRRTPPAAAAPAAAAAAAAAADRLSAAAGSPEASADGGAAAQDGAASADDGCAAADPAAAGDQQEQHAGAEGEEGGAERAESGQGAAAAQEAENSGAGRPAVSNRVFAGNLPFTASKSRLWDLFEQFGKVANVHIVKNPCTGKSKGFGFVTFKDDAGAQNALAADCTASLQLFGRQIRVSPAVPRSASARARAGADRRDRRPVTPPGPCHVDRLPVELLQLVLGLLPVREQVAAQRVSGRWRAAVRDLLRRRQHLDLHAFLLPGDFGRLTDGTLRRLLGLMPALRVLRTRGSARSCSYKALDIVATHCKNLVEIDLDGFCINEDSLKRLCVACPLLEEVKLPSHYHFSEASVWVLLRHLSALRVLELNSSDRVTGRCFSLLPASIRRLSVAGCEGLRSDSLRHVGARCPLLRHLDVSGVSGLQADDLTAALVGCTQMERLTARRLLVAPERYLPPAGLPGLQHLDLGSSEGVTDGTMRCLPDLLPGLHTLNIQGCSLVTEEGLLHVRRCKQLLSLDMSYLCHVTDGVLDKLHSLPLKQVHLAEGFGGPAAFTCGALARLVLGCHSLTLLDLSCVEALSEDLVELLSQQLSANRDVTLYVGGTLLDDLPSPPAAPLQLRNVNTVPLHMRGVVDDVLWDDYVDEFTDNELTDDSYHFSDEFDVEQDFVNFLKGYD